jgi:hypothetical protein
MGRIKKPKCSLCYDITICDGSFPVGIVELLFSLLSVGKGDYSVK